MELDKENYSKFHENQPDDPRIMTEVTWSEKVSIGYFSLVQKTNKNKLNRIVTHTCTSFR